MIKLKLNTDVYSINSMKQVMDIYKDYAEISIQQMGKIIIVEFSNCKYDETQTIQEFENYLIGLENSYGNC